MNGSEREVSFKPEGVSPLSYNTRLELTPTEKMDCVQFNASPFAKTIWKLCEIEIVQARDEALLVDPSNKELQSSKMTIAYAMNQFYIRLRNMVEIAITNHRAEIEQIALNEALSDQEKMEEIILSTINR